MKRKLKVDLAELVFAMDQSSYELRYYLDLETGEVILVMADLAGQLDAIYDEIYDEDGRRMSLEEYLEDWDGADWEKEALLEADQVEQGYPTRYIPIEKDDPHVDYRDMERFIPTVQDEGLRERLWRAIDGRGAFRYFKDVLWEHPELREDWFALKNTQQERRARDWLEKWEIELVS